MLRTHKEKQSEFRDAEIMECLASTRKISRPAYRKLIVDFVELEAGLSIQQCKEFVAEHASRKEQP